jgi:purine nucleoside permease
MKLLRRSSLAICLLFCVVAALAPLPAQAHAQRNAAPFKVKVFIITMFALEAQQWQAQEHLARKFLVPGADNPVECNDQGLCLTITGADKTNAAASMTAILGDPLFSFGKTYFLTAGTASTSPARGTLGMTAWSRWVVDWDQGFHLNSTDVPGNPYGYIPPSTAYSDSTSVFHLNEKLVDLAYNLTSHLTLQDSSAAQAQRQLYPEQSGQYPHVDRCDTLTGDNIWVGHDFSSVGQYITDRLTNNIGKNCTYEQEDTAVATALKRFGYLDRYLDLRGASAFDQPHPGQAAIDFINAHFRANDIAVANLYLVGSTVAHYLLNQPNQA